MVKRKGLGQGKGKGYKNIIGKDPIVHSQSAKGMKQPQKIKKMSEVQKQQRWKAIEMLNELSERIEEHLALYMGRDNKELENQIDIVRSQIVKGQLKNEDLQELREIVNLNYTEYVYHEGEQEKILHDIDKLEKLIKWW